jgi:hypothetical protein
MTDLLTSSRRIAALAAAAALLGTGALLSGPPAPASAAMHECPGSNFCLYFNEDANGGIYRNAGSDSNLNNDFYEEEDEGEIVGNTARNAFNNGSISPGEDNFDVLIYGGPSWTGPRDCIQFGDFGPLPRNWWNNIESYRWVTHSECLANGVIEL